jgi:hypothetical protein
MGKTGVVHDAGEGAPILVIEEDHGSITGQLQQAVMLNRLHEKYGLVNLVLESYSEGSLDDGAQNVRKAIANGTNEEIAAAMLSEGEINAVEFIKITHPTVAVIKGEKNSMKYNRGQGTEVEYLLKAKLALGLIVIDNKSVTDAVAEAFLRSLAKNHKIETAEQFEAIIDAADGLIKEDTWTRQRDGILFPQGTGELSIETEANALDEVVARVNQLPTQFAGLVTSISEFKSFLAARSAASDDMVSAALQVSRNKRTAVVAMIIGAAHTSKVTNLIQAANVPYTVIRASAMDSTLDVRLSPGSYDNKMKGRSVSIVLGSLFTSVPPTQIAAEKFKPAPVLQQEWLASKAELYSKVENLGSALAGSGDGGDKPPFTNIVAGFPDDFFRGKFFHIDRTKIKMTRDRGRKVITFPVVPDSEKGDDANILYVKITLSESERPPEGSTSRGEAALRSALEDLQRRGLQEGEETGKAKPSVELKEGHRQVTLKSTPLAEGLHLEQIRVSTKVHMIISNSESATRAANFRL